MPRPPGHGPLFETKRQEIIDLSAQLFAKKGYAATGLSDLCAYIGLSKGSLYYYIKSKEDLLVEIQSRVMHPLLSAARHLAKLDADPAVRLRLVSAALLEVIFQRLDHIWVYEHDYRQLSGEHRMRIMRQRGEFERIISNLLSEAIDVGLIQEMDTRLATLQFLNMHNHTYQWLKPDGAWNAERLSSEYFRTLMVGFGYDSSKISTVDDKVREIRENTPGVLIPGGTRGSQLSAI